MKYIWFCHEDLYNQDECDHLKNLLSVNDNTGITDISPSDSIKTAVVKHSWYHNELKLSLDKMIQTVININKNYFGFDLYPLTSYDSVNLNIYSEDNNGQYSWHVDGVIDQPYDVKLTAILNLTDEIITGGDFQFYPSAPETIESFKKQGSLIVFPSFIQHRVTPVLKGTRKTLALWMSGPSWK